MSGPLPPSAMFYKTPFTSTIYSKQSHGGSFNMYMKVKSYKFL